MPNKMLIDASHPEETRVVVTRGNRIEEFDFESQDKRQLKGNIYLARVTRVEPSLQAAFVEYGGNRHGFLAFSEIHPDYYQIPVADRQAILRDEAEQVRADDENGDEEDSRQSRGRGRKKRRSSRSSSGNGATDAAENDDGESAEDSPAIAAEAVEDGVISESAPDHGNTSKTHDDDAEVDTVGSEDAIDEAQTRRKPVRRNYKIQEVIKRRQILLVQVVKEERGNKGAAITTYLSLAGRYSVLMPNTARGGGISRKITSVPDRKRLKDIVRELEVPEGMGVILRTAGANRTRAEVKRDYEYLMRMWEKVRGLTLQSTAPALVYEEGSLIKRSIRDLYNKEIGEVLVAGEEGYREAKDFMRLLMPSHAKAVQPYRDMVPIFARSGIEGQLDKMLQPHVTLKSGGYIIINQTEALVAIDVNSGRSTKEHSIEDTALQTNLEAADEVARQLRLRDLAGLIVIDFIDMEENRNNRSVEKRVKDCLKNDRARIQVGRISHFGLLEMSRQRIRASVLESTMQPCPLCGGNGHVRSESSVALLVVRAIEEYLLKDWQNDLTVRTPASTALYVLNHKRANLVALEQRFGVNIDVEADDAVGSQYYAFVKGPPAENPGSIENVIVPETPLIEMDEEEPATEPEDTNADESNREPENDNSDSGRGKRRRRRKRRGGRDRSSDENGHAEEATPDQDGDQASESEGQANEDQTSAQSGDDGGERKKRRRGKRGGKRNRRDENAVAEASGNDPDGQAHHDHQDAVTADNDAQRDDGAVAASGETAQVPTDQETGPTSPENVEAAPEKPKRKRAPRRKAAKSTDDQIADETTTASSAPDQQDSSPSEAEKPDSDAADNVTPIRKPPEDTRQEDITSEPVVSSSGTEEKKKPRKAGWWQRKGFF